MSAPLCFLKKFSDLDGPLPVYSLLGVSYPVKFPMTCHVLPDPDLPNVINTYGWGPFGSRQVSRSLLTSGHGIAFFCDDGVSAVTEVGIIAVRDDDDEL